MQKIEKILDTYFDAEDIGEIRKILSVNSEKWLVSSPDVIKESKEVDSRAIISRAQIDLLITYAEKNLSHNKHIQFLLILGETIKNSGEYDAAVSIFNSLVNNVGDESKLASIKINCCLAIADIYEKQAYWQESLALVKKAKYSFRMLKDNKGIAFCENFLGTIYGEQGNIKKAKSQFEKSLSLLNPAKDKA